MTGARPWEGHRAWVTGGKRGLGLAFARAFAERGAAVHITARDPASPTVLAALAQLRELGAVAACAHALDLADSGSVAALGDALRDAPPRILVHSAHAFAAHTPIVGLKPEQLEESLRSNVVGAYGVLRAAARLMRRRGTGRLLVVGSLASQVGGVGQAVYIAEKAALGGLALAFASEFGRDGVSCNVVHPGIVDTENVRERVPEQVRAAFAQLTRTGRLLTADEVVDQALHLVEPEQAVPNGQALLLDDGATAALRAQLLPAVSAGPGRDEP
ncbi:MAG: SDR family oxidoreductase [Sandaracinaceae bacterium]|nr:SDR family oxidoreductase [Sandaracinaceae bacterium]